MSVLFIYNYPLASQPRWERLSWVNSSDTSITITWNDSIQGEGRVEIRLLGNQNPIFTGNATVISSGTSNLGFIYTVTVSNLSPSTEYEYRVYSDNSWSQWHRFKTAPRQFSCELFSFVMTGDSRGESCNIPIICDDDHYEESPNWNTQAEEIRREEPLFLLHTGDFVHNGSKPEQWEDEFEQTNFIPLVRSLPFFLSLGNHDTDSVTGENALFNKLFEYPRQNPQQVEDYYYFVVGNLLVVSLSTETFSMQDQLNWLETVLTEYDNKVDWKIVMFHRPIWSSGVAHGSNENNIPRASEMIPILDRHKVDLVINGHEHIYERFHPLKGYNNGKPTEINPLPEENGHKGVANGTIYMILGGGGAILSEVIRTIDGSAVHAERFHYARVIVNKGIMRIDVRDLGGRFTANPTGQNLDWIELYKPTTVCIEEREDGGVKDGGKDSVVDTKIEGDRSSIDISKRDEGERETTSNNDPKPKDGNSSSNNSRKKGGCSGCNITGYATTSMELSYLIVLIIYGIPLFKRWKK